MVYMKGKLLKDVSGHSKGIAYQWFADERTLLRLDIIVWKSFVRRCFVLGGKLCSETASIFLGQQFI